MLIIHHLGLSVSERAVWLCEELGIEYELKRYLRDPKTRLAPKEYKALHPYETSPVIEDGKVCLTESGAIVEYILNKYANSQQIEQITYSKDDEEYADYVFFKHFADASIHENVMLNGTVMRLTGGKEIENETMKSLIGRLSKAYELLEKQLIKQKKNNSKFIVGNKFTLADLLLFFPLSTMRNFLPFPKTLDDYPNVKAYVNTIGQLPSYQRTIKRADPERDFLVKL